MLWHYFRRSSIAFLFLFLRKLHHNHTFNEYFVYHRYLSSFWCTSGILTFSHSPSICYCGFTEWHPNFFFAYFYYQVVLPLTFTVKENLICYFFAIIFWFSTHNLSSKFSAEWKGLYLRKLNFTNRILGVESQVH